MKYFAALLLSAVLFVACGDESSSSAPAPDPSEESSSSVEKTKESSSSVKPTSGEDKQSSSSAKKEDSSSSAVKASSSSVTPKSSSSGEVKQSSSSVVASSSSVTSSETVKSSSSEYVPFDRTEAFDGDHWRAGDYVKFTDPRDNKEYYYIQITGKDSAGKDASIKVMAENLNVGEMVRGGRNQEDDSKIERYCYKNDTTNCARYGALYQWAEMMQLPSECNTKSCANLIKPNHQGICPNGWRLLTYNDFYIVVHADGNVDGPKGTRSAYGFGGSNDTGYSLVGAGYLWDHAFKDVKEATYWHYPVESGKYGDLSSIAGMQWTGSTTNPYDDVYKTHGFSVRCVMVE
ncbi:MAG: fibrobacter succinogenes major paralogous domain-containing protein [Fibrobacter sp.]|nr:fibrobacter succinogenes major paralogous domain-containing protein [Fibrobacter sp.]